MKRFKNTLLVHRQPCANAILKQAVSQAKRNRAQITILDFIEELPREIRKLLTAITPQELVIKERRKHLERLIAPLREKRMSRE